MKRILPALPMMSTADVPRDLSLGIYMESDDNGLEIFLHGIVGDDYTGTDSQTVAQALARHRGKPVTLRVNSPGGLAYDGVAIYNAMATHDGPTVGIIEGTAGSAASLAILGADTVRSYPSGIFAPHYAIMLAYGHQSDLREALTRLQKLDTEIEKLYAERSGQDLATVKDQLTGPEGDGTHFNAEEAKAAGYVDEIIEMPKKRKPEAKSSSLARLQAEVALLAMGNLDSLPNRL